MIINYKISILKMIHYPSKKKLIKQSIHTYVYLSKGLLDE